MPTYDYRCTACKHSFEEFQMMSAKHLRKCPKCGKPALERLIGTGAAIVFKGSGFYQTDYRSEGYKKSAEADKPVSDSPAKPDTRPEGKPDARPETKTETKTDVKTDVKPAAKAPDSTKQDTTVDVKPKGKTKKA